HQAGRAFTAPAHEARERSAGRKRKRRRAREGATPPVPGRGIWKLLLLDRGWLAGARRLHLDLDLPRLRLRALREPDAEDAVLAFRGDVLRVDGGRQREAALERAVGALDALVAVLARRLLELALAAHGEGVVLDVQVDVVRVDLGQLDLQGDAVGVLEHVDQRRPGAGEALLTLRGATA